MEGIAFVALAIFQEDDGVADLLVVEELEADSDTYGYWHSLFVQLSNKCLCRAIN